jgi:hypothetical protein
MTMRVGSEIMENWSRQADFQFFEFRASNIFMHLASPFSNVTDQALTSTVKLACLKRSNFAPESS